MQEMNVAQPDITRLQAARIQTAHPGPAHGREPLLQGGVYGGHVAGNAHPGAGRGGGGHPGGRRGGGGAYPGAQGFPRGGQPAAWSLPLTLGPIG